MFFPLVSHERCDANQVPSACVGIDSSNSFDYTWRLGWNREEIHLGDLRLQCWHGEIGEGFATLVSTN